MQIPWNSQKMHRTLKESYKIHKKPIHRSASCGNLRRPHWTKTSTGWLFHCSQTVLLPMCYYAAFFWCIASMAASASVKSFLEGLQICHDKTQKKILRFRPFSWLLPPLGWSFGAFWSSDGPSLRVSSCLRRPGCHACMCVIELHAPISWPVLLSPFALGLSLPASQPVSGFVCCLLSLLLFFLVFLFLSSCCVVFLCCAWCQLTEMTKKCRGPPAPSSHTSDTVTSSLRVSVGGWLV